MTDQESGAPGTWADYYNIVSGRPVREFLRHTARRFAEPGLAVDLGCGHGAETVYLLTQGWQVLAIDQEEAAIRRLRATLAPAVQGLVETRVAAFEDIVLPAADLIWAGLSLPFCQADVLADLLQEIQMALNPGGRFAGDFFGPRHAWRSVDHINCHSKEQVLALCEGLTVEYLIEEEGQQQTAMSGLQQWHQFSVCARKEA
ncbi:MAG: class I SAM-dependent methyltransferase [Candidatus Promineifilaceae bacterium]|nr:class I SAM-dependent methyltransferase [Candidatus Promineifilaceae bacterium]